MYDFDRPIDRRNTASVKFDLAEANGYPADVLPMWVADMDFQAPPCVLQALGKAVEHGIFGYSFLPESYYEAVQAWFARRFDWQVERDWILTTPGVVFALASAIRAATEPGDGVMVQSPVYYPFYKAIEQNGRKLVENPLVYADGKYCVDFLDFERKITDHQVKLFVLCSPHNPVCRVWTLPELQTIGAICKKHGVKVIADEIHCDFAFPEHPHTPFLKACPDMAEDVILCTAPSKTFNLAGLQVSNIFIPGKELRERFGQDLELCSYHGPNCLGAIACQAAYRGGEDWLDACKAYMRGNLDYIRSYLAEHLPQIRLVEPEGTYFAWLDCSGLGLSKEALDELIIHKAGLWLDSGAIFGQAAAQFQRVVLACPRATVEAAMDRLHRALQP